MKYQTPVGERASLEEARQAVFSAGQDGRVNLVQGQGRIEAEDGRVYTVLEDGRAVLHQGAREEW